MMTYAEDVGLESIVSWVDKGRALQVNNSKCLVEEILPLFFKQTKYRSFQRQLNMWSFERILCGCNRGAFQHPYFIKGRIDLCQHQTRHTFQRSMPNSSQIEQLKKELRASFSTNDNNMIAATCTSTATSAVETTHLSVPSAAELTCEDDDGEYILWKEETTITTTSLYHVLDQKKFITMAYDKKPIHEELRKMMRELFEPNQSLFDVFEDSNMGSSSSSSCWADGDIVPFEGRQFHFLDAEAVE
jgi:hypothetical protein